MCVCSVGPHTCLCLACPRQARLLSRAMHQIFTSCEMEEIMLVLVVLREFSPFAREVSRAFFPIVQIMNEQAIGVTPMQTLHFPVVRKLTQWC